MIVLDIDLYETLGLGALAGSISIVVTCTTAGWPLRFLWCAMFRPRWLRWLWKLARCPHCNAWWSGLGVGLLAGFDLTHGFAQAFATCGMVFVVQHALLALGHDITPEEDLELLLGL